MLVHFAMGGVGDQTDKQVCRQLDKAIAELESARFILAKEINRS